MWNKGEKWKSIKIKEDLWRFLLERGAKGETFDEIIRKLINFEERRQNEEKRD